MIAANGVTARYLAAKQLPSLRRVVRTPKRWDRIVELAAERGTTLPREPDAKALEQFLASAKAADPLRFPDLSLSVIKLLGPGEYVVELPGGGRRRALRPGGQGLRALHRPEPPLPRPDHPAAAEGGAGGTRPALRERRAGRRSRRHCTEAEDAAKKVERQVAKSAAALLLESRIGEQFDAIVTGASDKGTWVRLLHPPVEGRLDERFAGLDVGHQLRVQLVSTDVERGFIDFRRVV